MKAKLSVLTGLILLQFAAKAQMKIGDNPTTINNASLLELESTNKGLVFSSVSLTNVSSPDPLPAGLLPGTTVYNTNGSVVNGNGAGLYVWNGFVWMSVVSSGGSSSGWSLTGNLGTSPGANFLGTIDASDLVVKTDNLERLRILGTSFAQGQPGYIAIGGIAPPRSILDVTADLPNTNIITIQNNAANGYSTIDMRDNFGQITGTFGYANSSAGFLPGTDYFNVYNKDFVISAFGPNSTNFFLQGSSTGYIGIGTNTPQQRLHVHGKFYLDSAFMPFGNAGLPGQVLASQGPDLPPVWTNAGGSGGGWLLAGNTGTNPIIDFLGTTDNADLVIKTNSSERLRVAGGSGYVGIGGRAIPPRALLDVTGILPGSNLITVENDAPDGYSSIDMRDNNGQLVGTFGYANPGAGSLGDRDYFNVYNKDFVITALGANANNFFLKGSSTGYIGIGTDAPQERLHVNGNLQLDGAFMPAGNAGLAGQVLSSQGPGLPPVWQAASGGGSGWLLTGNGGTNPANQFLGTTDAIDFVVRTNSVERMRVKDVTGNIGIGTANPGSALDVKGELRLSGATSGFVGFQPAAAAGSTTYTLPSADGTNGQMLTTNGNKILSWTTPPGGSGGGSSWSLTGNTGTSSSVNFVGTTDDRALVFRVNNTTAGFLGSANDGQGRTSFGFSANASDQYTTAIGREAKATGNSAVALGYLANASSQNALAIGVSSKANQTTSVAIGYQAQATQQSSMALGSASTAGGLGSIVIGNNSTSTGGQNAIVIGNGITGVNQSDVFILGDPTKVKVGVGTIAPANKLTVVDASGADPLYLGGIKAITNYTNADSVLTISNGVVKKYKANLGSPSLGWGISGNSGTNSGTDFMGTTDDISLRVRTNDLERMVIDSMGNIGIGTSIPANKLSVLALADPLYLAGVQATSTFTADSVLTINAGVVKKAPYSALPSGGGGSGWLLAGNGGTNPSSEFLGTTDAIDFVLRTNNVERMRVKDVTGNIGIGIANPGSALDIKGALRLSGSTSGFVGFQPAATAGSTTYTLPVADGTTGQMLTTDGGGALSWTTPPGGGGGGSWGLTGNSGTNSGTDFMGTTDDVSFRVRTNNIERMVFDSVGKVGIGTANPTNKLSVVTLANPLYLAGVLETTTFTDDSLLTIKDGVVKKTPYASLSSTSGWSLSGNDISGITGSFLGTTSNNGLVFKVNDTRAGYLGNSFENQILFGLGATTNGPYTGTTVIGTNAQANNMNTIALGIASNAAGQYASAIGPQSYAAGSFSIAIGQSTVAAGNNSVAIGAGVTTEMDNAFILGNPLTAMVGIGTSTPAANTKLDVNGGFKLGAAGTVTKNSESFSSPVNISVPAGGSNEIMIALPNNLSSTQASVAASPQNDLPDGVFIAFARVIAPNALKIRLINTAGSDKTVTGNFYCTVTEF
ncbi:MAG TPA: hypothetical protein VFW07_15720 [Parafilimonas sp.]|nr:hypothetical protein [Parafilimonas sp.]